MDKVQKIREEVERLMYGFNLEADIASCEDAETEKLANIKYQLCKKILDYIDEVQKEPVSEDLEEAAHEYADLRMSNYETAFYAFMSGAKWQKEQFEKTLRDRIINAYNRGRKQMKQQMMAKAIDGVITFDYYGDDDKTYGCVAHDSFCLEDFALKDKDKVRMILIKED